MINLRKQTGSALIVIIIVIFIALLGVLGYVVWNNFFASKDNAIQTAKEEVATPIQKQDSIPDVKSNQMSFEIPELNITLSIPKSLSDLTYYYEGNEQVSFSTEALTAYDHSCAASGNAPPLGSLAVGRGVYPEDPNIDNARGILVKQFDKYYIGYYNPQSLCSSDQTKVPKELEEFKAALLTIKEL